MNRLPRVARQAIIASGIGLSVSLLLFAILDYQSKLDHLTGLENALFWFQIVGLFKAWGLDSRISAAVMISVNALIYSVIAFGFLILFDRSKIAKRQN
jgi:hypothetical protein